MWLSVVIHTEIYTVSPIREKNTAGFFPVLACCNRAWSMTRILLFSQVVAIELGPSDKNTAVLAY